MLQEIYHEAILFSGEKHKDQLVPGTEINYLMHISNVAMEILIAYQHEPSFNMERAVRLALLHDTLEDTNTTYEELSEKFGSEIASGVLALTKQDNFATKAEKMLDSLERISATFEEVKLVKIADRITNLQKPPSHWSKEKIKAYWLEAQTIHQTLKGSHDYLDRRLAQKIDGYEIYFS